MIKEIALARPLQTDSVVDGKGLRCVLWTQGCPHKCVGCHNPSTHSFDGGSRYTVNSIINGLSKVLYHDGLTISGGEPMEQAEALIPIVQYAVDNGLNVWCYSGYTLEELQNKNDQHINELLGLIDVLIDGRFILAEKSANLAYRGSRNQKIIKMK
jgi:anaerobic ribonucleoside-triphosphate reductase activating protein